VDAYGRRTIHVEKRHSLWGESSTPVVHPQLKFAFVPIRIVTTIISPSFFTAAIFALLGRVIRRVGTEYSWLTPRWRECNSTGPHPSTAALMHPPPRCSPDYFSRIGPRCSRCAILRRGTGCDGQHEGRIRPRWKQYVFTFLVLCKYTAEHCCEVMMIGIIIQLVAVVIFALVAAEFIWRICVDRPARGRASIESNATLQGRPEGRVRVSQPTRLLLVGMGISTFLVVVRFVHLIGVPITLLTSSYLGRFTERLNSQTAGTVRSSPLSGISTSSMPPPSFSPWLQSIFSIQKGSISPLLQLP